MINMQNANSAVAHIASADLIERLCHWKFTEKSEEDRMNEMKQKRNERQI